MEKTAKNLSWESNQTKVLKSNQSKPTNFRNSSHSVRLLEVLQSLRKDEVLCDISLKTDDGTIVLGHKYVLMAASQYFHAMFSNLNESNKYLVNIRELNSTILQLIINYIYTGEIMITEENVQGLLPASNILQIDYVKYACSEFLQTRLNPSNCLGIKAFADLHNCMELLLSSEAFIKKQFIEVVKCEEFLSLSFEAVVKLISCNDLNVPFEEIVYECIINWVNHELDHRIEFLPGLMEHVRLPLASIDYILKKVVEEPLIKNSSKCNSYVVEALHFHLHKTNPHITIPQTVRCSSRQPAGGLQKVVLVLSWDKTIRSICINWYDPITEKWEITPEMTKFPNSAGLSIIKDQFLFALGGFHHSSSRSVKMLNLASQSPIWVPTVDMLVSRRYLGVAVLDNCIYVVGGKSDDATTLNSVEVFDISIQKWRMVSSMTIKRQALGVGILNNLLYAVGGYDGSSSLKSVECYDPSLDKWTTVAEMSVCRYGVGVGVLDGIIYAIGGRIGSGPPLKSVEAYKPSDGVWTSVADMHECRVYAGVITFNGLLYVMGGNTNISTYKTFEIYNPATNSWKLNKSIDSNTVGGIFGAVAFNRPPYLRFN